MTDATEHKYVQETVNWINALPIANVGKSAEMVFTYLGDMPADELSAKELFTTLENFQPTMVFLWDALRKYYLGQTSITTSQKPKIIHLAKSLENRYATLYAMIIGKILKQPDIKDMRSLYAQTIHRAMLHLTNVLIICYQIYSTAPANLWRKLHKLYLHAESRDLGNITIEYQHDTDSLLQTTIDNTYKHCLLLSAANPYHLRYKEVEILHQTLTKWAQKADIIEDNFDDAVFLFRLDLDKGPRHRVLMNDDRNSEFARGLDTKPLITHVKNIIKQQHDADQNKVDISRMSITFLEYLVDVWGAFKSRKFPRKTIQGEMDLCIGLSSAHYFLNDEQSFMPDTINFAQSFPGSTPTNLSIKTEEKPKQEEKIVTDYYDPWEPLFEHTPQAVEFGKNLEIESDIVKPKYKTQSWKLINASPGGFCLIRHIEDVTEVQAGEIIGLREPSHKLPHQWHIGNICWVKQNKHKDTKIGVQVLSPSAMAVAVQLRGTAKTEYLRALLLPELINLGQAATLIIPPLDVHEGQEAHIVSESLEAEIKFTELLMSNDSFSQFAYETINTIKEEVTVSEEITHEDELEDYDSVWDDFDKLS